MIKVSDLWNCAYLVCNGAEIKSVETQENNGKSAVFFIVSGSNADKHNQEFLNGKATANVTQLKLTMNHLKDLLFDKLRQRKENENENNKYSQRNYFRNQKSKQYN